MDVLTWTQMAAGEALETVASYPIGQVVLKQVDNFLWLLEKSSQWALPAPSADDEDKTMVVSELIRPLPWILFLPILVFLRIARESISFGALMMGKDPIRPSSIIKKSTRKAPKSPSSGVEDDNILDDSTALLKNLLSNLEHFVETDSDDSDYSVKNEGTQTSGTSSSSDSEEEDVEDNEVEEYYQPEDEQNSSHKKVKTNGVKGKKSPPPQCDATKEDVMMNGTSPKKIAVEESLKNFIESEKQMSEQSDLKENTKSRLASKSPNKIPKTTPKKGANQKPAADSNSLPVVMVTPAAESPNKSTTILHPAKSPCKKQQSPHHDRH